MMMGMVYLLLVIISVSGLTIAKGAVLSSSRPLLLTSASRQNPVNGRCCFIDACNNKAVCPDAGTLYLDSCGDKYKLSQNCTRTLRKKKDDSSCCFFDTCDRKTVCRPRGGQYRCNGTHDVTDSCDLVLRPGQSPSPTVSPFLESEPSPAPTQMVNTLAPTTTVPTTTTASTTSTSPTTSPITRFSDCCYMDACNGAIICRNVGMGILDSCGLAYIVNPDCKLSRPGKVSNGKKDCCYMDPCNKKTICGSKNSKLVDSCGSEFNIDGACKLSRSGSQGDCCYVDRCNFSTICGSRGGLLVDSCKLSYNVGPECDLHRVLRV